MRGEMDGAASAGSKSPDQRACTRRWADAPNGLERDGFALLRGVVTQDRVHELARIVSSVRADAWVRRRGVPYAVRNIDLECEEIAEVLSVSGVDALAKRFLGESASVVQATLFDKGAAANWSVPSHQDVVVPVARCRDTRGLSSFTRRKGVEYAAAPAALLSRMVALRIHLDDCAAGGGALEIAPGTHTRRLSSREIESFDRSRFVTCVARAGDVLAMRPLALHGSSSSSVPGHRRVLHVLYGSELASKLDHSSP
jgi:hypothetical protein